MSGAGEPDLPGAVLSSTEAAGATAFVLSIEPEPDADPGPSATKILGGDIVSGVALLSLAHPAALGTDFAGALASFILETPSTAGIAGDYSQGIWWLDPAGPAASAVLPALPVGWTYEGWVVGGGPVSTGRFRDAAGPDDDGAGPAAGPDGTPPFPGQDFIAPAMDLVGLAAVLTVEPEPDDSPAPFLLKPLVDGVIEDVGAGVLQPMANQSANNPSGRVDLN